MVGNLVYCSHMRQIGFGRVDFCCRRQALKSEGATVEKLTRKKHMES
jgi:hypothetical protein